MNIPKFETAVLQGICEVLGATNDGLTGSEIGKALDACSIFDVEPKITKRDRIYAALSRRQEQDSCGNHVVAFIQHTLNPVKYAHSHECFLARQGRLNAVLVFAGMLLGEDGKVRACERVTTVSEAAQRASRLRKGLLERRVHSDVLAFCREELVVENYFHAVFEATKSVAEKIRQRAGIVADGSELVDMAFSFRGRHPLLALNSLQSESDQSEQSGFMNLLKGLFGMFRNTTAHAPKIKWNISEQDALDTLSMISLIHRRLDAAIRVPTAVVQQSTAA